jgi:hypothetical protein
MGDSEYIKIRRSDLLAALMSAFDAGWSGTPEVAESVVHAIMTDLARSIVPTIDDSILIQKLSSMVGKKWKGQVANEYLPPSGQFYPPPNPQQIIYTTSAYDGTIKAMDLYKQKSMYDDWDEHQ